MIKQISMTAMIRDLLDILSVLLCRFRSNLSPPSFILFIQPGRLFSDRFILMSSQYRCCLEP